MIAKKNPGKFPEGKVTYKDAAEAYGLTVQQFRDADVAFLNSEGYKSDGHECETLHDWLTYQPKHSLREPFHKGDEFNEEEF